MRILSTVPFAAAIAIAFVAGASFGASQATSKVTTLLQVPLDQDFTPGREVLVDRVEIPPNTALDRHWHPGEEFHYYLEGSPEIEIAGGEILRPALGTVGHVPFRTLHRAGAGDTGATILVFRVHTAGEPWRYLEDAAAGGHDAHRR